MLNRRATISRRLAGLALASLLLSGCASTVWDEVNLMPAPDVHADGRLDPLPDRDPMDLIPYGGILYATDRRPASEGDNEKYYVNDRGQLVRLGVARISLHNADVDWSELRQMSLSKTRPKDYPIRVTGVTEYGILEDTIPGFARREEYGDDLLDGERIVGLRPLSPLGPSTGILSNPEVEWNWVTDWITDDPGELSG